MFFLSHAGHKETSLNTVLLSVKEKKKRKKSTVLVQCKNVFLSSAEVKMRVQ